MINWKYYNHAAIPTTAPHQNPDLLSVENGSVWKIEGRYPLLARWTTDFDCGYETNWWYVIKDDVFDVAELKAKRRYEINKGNKNFHVVRIDPSNYKEELYDVQVKAFSAYPKKYRPAVDKKLFLSDIENWKAFTVFAAFHRETGELSGYALLSQACSDCVDFMVLKTKPEYERLSINASLVTEILNYYRYFLSNGGYICDGARSISHEMKFQDYLEKYFGFRKAYCHLHIRYNPKMKWLIKFCFPLRKMLLLLDGIGIVHQINSVMKMEEICRSEISGK